MDQEKNPKTEFEYETLSKFNESGLAIAMKDGKYGVLDKNFAQILPFQFDEDQPQYPDGTPLHGRDLGEVPVEVAIH